MYNYKLWNKVDPINGVGKDYWIENNTLFKTEEVVLCFNSNDPSERITTIFLENELRNSYQDYECELDKLIKLRLESLEGKGFDSAIELIKQNEEMKTELASAKLTLMEEGLI